VLLVRLNSIIFTCEQKEQFTEARTNDQDSSPRSTTVSTIFIFLFSSRKQPGVEGLKSIMTYKENEANHLFIVKSSIICMKCYKYVNKANIFLQQEIIRKI